MSEVRGTCDPAFNKLKTLLQEFVTSGEELGASIYVDIDGKSVVDLQAGYADPERTKLWTEDTIVCVWSVSKNITNLAALILADRGLLDVHAKVSKYWPEFGVNGKEDIEVRHLLSHTAGLPGWEHPITLEEMYDLPKATNWLAEQAPFWKPGTASGYHAFTQGHLVGELIRRVSGKSAKQFIQDEMAGPLKADYQLGALEKDWPRITDVIPSTSGAVRPAPELGEVLIKTLKSMPEKADFSWTPEFRRAELSGANGFGNARSIARILSMISLGGDVDGKHFLSPKTLELIFEKQSEGPDLVLGRYDRFGIGFGLPVKEVCDWIPEEQVCYWSGWGGAIAVMDVGRRMTICYAMNKMGTGTVGSPRTEAYVRAVYEAIKS